MIMNKYSEQKIGHINLNNNGDLFGEFSYRIELKRILNF